VTYSLSGRLVEVNYEYCAAMAAECGYDAVELRPTQVPAGMSIDEASALRTAFDSSGVDVSAVLLPNSLASKRLKDTDDDPLRRHLELVAELGCSVVKTWFNDVGVVGDVCDIVEPFGMSVVSQIHANGPLETVPSCIEAIRSLDRDNFGLQYDAANLFESGKEYRDSAIRALAGSIHQISVQNAARADSQTPGAWESDGRWYRRCLIGDPEGLDFGAVFRALAAIDFDGCVVVNEPKPTILDTREFARHTMSALQTIVASSGGHGNSGS